MANRRAGAARTACRPAATSLPWWERVVIALVGVASPLQGGLPVAGPGLRRSGAAPRRLQLVEPGMVWLDFHPGPAPKQARRCNRQPTGQAYRYQLGPIRRIIPALEEAFRSVRPEQYPGVREQSRAETPRWGIVAFADSITFLSTSTSERGRGAGFCRCPIVELGHVDGGGVAGQ
jgi:hypothetical protein